LAFTPKRVQERQLEFKRERELKRERERERRWVVRNLEG
jgi:hypothetical protein